MKHLLLATAVALVPAAVAAQGTTYVGAELRYEKYDSDSATFFEPYVEYEAPSGFYVGIWMGNLYDSAPDNVETDLYFGLRGDVGAVSYDVNYTRYYYDSTGDCCGEFNAVFDYSAGVIDFETELDYYDETGAEESYITQTATWNVTDPFAPYLSGTWYDTSTPDEAEIGFDYTFASKFTFSADYIDFTDNTNEWQAGLEYALNDTTVLGTAYHEYGDDTTMLEVYLTWDTDWATLTGG